MRMKTGISVIAATLLCGCIASVSFAGRAGASESVTSIDQSGLIKVGEVDVPEAIVAHPGAAEGTNVVKGYLPEPGSVLLVGTGALFGLGYYLRRRMT